MKREGDYFIFFIFVFALLLSPAMLHAQEDDPQVLKEKIKKLESRVQQLESQLDEKSAVEQKKLDPFTAEWDPFAEMERMHREMNRMFRDSYGRGFGSSVGNFSKTDPFFDPQIDITETDKSYVFKIDLPGMDKESMNVEVQDRMLLISGERNSAVEEQEDGKFYRRERSFGQFSRRLVLPDDAKADDLKAEYENGVLTITIGRTKAVDKETIESKRIPIY
ncbi:MAG: Hsp20/alpha crystallin family protein [Candidatus Omnitrophica bacterium]|nr:Hsp20/alpha crystallin family protein [Candidatus Omnitrophota bacterium]